MASSLPVRRRIGFVIYPDVTALDVAGPMEAFNAAKTTRRDGIQRKHYELVVIGTTSKPLKSESGLILHADCTLESAPPLDTVMVVGGRGVREPRTMGLIGHWVAQHAKKIRRIASVCTGVYGLASSGLLDGRRVATHWAFAQDLASQFPQVTVDANALYVKDGKFYTSAGTTAGIDLSLALIEEDLGPSVAVSVARELVVYLKRSGDQAQYSEPLRFQARSTDQFANLMAWLPANLHLPLSVETLARRTHLGTRHFSRRFSATFNTTPAAFIERQRMNQARLRLTDSRATVDKVAGSVGFKSADAFRRAFEHCFGVSPSAYRERFDSRTEKP